MTALLATLQVAMAHASSDEAPIPDGYSAADEFFIYKFSKEQAGLSGLAFDEGIFGVCGYVTEVHFLCLMPCTHLHSLSVPIHNKRGCGCFLRSILHAIDGDWKIDGRSCGYQGLELLPQLQSGDVIVSSRIVDGAEHLVRPSAG